jgi:mRNA interferase MazF
MIKEFDQWNEKKKETHDRATSPFFHKREIWWCSLGVNVGFEQDGSGGEYRRPVLVLLGLSRQTCLIIPLTTSGKRHPLRPSIGVIAGKEAYALLSQVRVVDAKRLVRKICRLDKGTFERIRKTVKDML